MGPLCSLPWGYAIFTGLMCLLQGLIGAILWKTMYHEPDDDLAQDERPRFVLRDID